MQAMHFTGINYFLFSVPSFIYFHTRAFKLYAISPTITTIDNMLDAFVVHANQHCTRITGTSVATSCDNAVAWSATKSSCLSVCLTWNRTCVLPSVVVIHARSLTSPWNFYFRWLDDVKRKNNIGEQNTLFPGCIINKLK